MFPSFSPLQVTSWTIEVVTKGVEPTTVNALSAKHPCASVIVTV
jgi:hypothetical protein